MTTDILAALKIGTIALLLALSLPLFAADLSLKQQILMPGPLISGHADIEADCESCHSPFAKQAISDRCLQCHEDIAADRNSHKGFHGLSPAAANGACESCHTDHEGRDADISGLLQDSFQHQHTNFPLDGSHLHLQCDQCHEQQPWRKADTACISCHRKDDRHQGALGEQCEQCHQTSLWTRQLAFDHSKTDFPLLGQHRELRCVSCHINQQYQFADNRCISCHRANDIHSGSNGEDCGSCHSAKAWTEVRFDHDETDFPLHGRHQDVPCTACHKADQPRDKTDTACSSCHHNDDIHLGAYGKQCQDCHTETRWSKPTFDHDRATAFPLTGKHRDVNCGQCHRGSLNEELSSDCSSCHRSDDVHNNPTMAQCGSCHNTQSWQSTRQFDHDLSEFPLIGMHRIVPCQNCHVAGQYRFADSSCHACHERDDKHQGGLGNDCALCHTPNSWALWQFDHSQQTAFELGGKHQGIACAACHLSASDPAQTPTLCGSCHRQQDIHRGEFGLHCERCHSTTNFFELNLE